jgi:hypothetical protein
MMLLLGVTPIVVSSLVDSPVESLIALGVTATGVPVYYLCFWRGNQLWRLHLHSLACLYTYLSLPSFSCYLCLGYRYEYLREYCRRKSEYARLD